jgi:hypothetical protein
MVIHSSKFDDIFSWRDRRIEVIANSKFKTGKSIGEQWSTTTWTSLPFWHMESIERGKFGAFAIFIRGLYTQLYTFVLTISYYFDRALMPMLKFMLLVLFQIGATNSGESNSMEWYNCNASCCRGRTYAYYSMLAGSWSRCEREIISWMVFIWILHNVLNSSCIERERER